MAVNITLTGDIYNDIGIMFTGSEVHYQVYFYKVNVSSSDSVWSNPRLSISGQYNFNLADSDLLTTDGSAASGDRVVVVFWTGPTTNRNDDCTTLEEWGAFEVVLGTGPGMLSADTYVNNTQIKTNIPPNLVWSLTNSGYVDTNYTATNTSYDVHSWTISGTQMYHWRTRYGEDIQLINTVSGSKYIWGDGSSDLVAGTTNVAHQWSSAGSYDVQLVIWDECGSTVTGVETIDIEWHAPVPDITITPADPAPNEPVSFNWSGTDQDDKITSIDWTINDSGVYGNTDTTVSGARDDIISHSSGTGTDWCGQVGNAGAFTNPGSHLIEITYHWSDGFSNHSDTYSESFTQDRFSGPSVDFNQVPAQAVLGSGVVFTNETVDTSRVGLGLPDCDQYNWTWTDDGVSEQESDKLYSFDLEKTPDSVNCQVQLCANWSDGWDTQTTCESKNVVFETTVTIIPRDYYYVLNISGTAEDGTVGSYSWTVASGVGEFGPWTDIWYSPNDLDQNNKRILFTSVAWYKITGYIHSSGEGDSTSDDDKVYADLSGIRVVPIERYITLTEGLDIQVIGQNYLPDLLSDVDEDPEVHVTSENVDLKVSSEELKPGIRARVEDDD